MDEATLALVRRLAADVADGRGCSSSPVARRPEAPVDAGRTSPPYRPAAAASPAAATNCSAWQRRRTAPAGAPAAPAGRTRRRQPAVPHPPGAGAAAGADLDALPDSLEGMIAAQIDRLPAPRAAGCGPRRCSAWWSTRPGSRRCSPAMTSSEDGGRARGVHHDAPRLATALRAPPGAADRLRGIAIPPAHRAARPRRRDLETALGQRRDHYAALLSLHCLHGGATPPHGGTRALRATRRARSTRSPRPPSATAERCRRRPRPTSSPTRRSPTSTRRWPRSARSGRDGRSGAGAAPGPATRPARPHRFARLHLKTARHRQHIGKRSDALRWVSRGRSAISRHDDEAALRLRAELAERGAPIRYDQGSYKTSMAWAARAVGRPEPRATRGWRRESRGARRAVGTRRVARRRGRVKDALALYDVPAICAARRAPPMPSACGPTSPGAGTPRSLLRRRPRPRLQIGRDFDAAAVAANQAEVLVQQGRDDAADAARPRDQNPRGRQRHELPGLRAGLERSHRPRPEPLPRRWTASPRHAGSLWRWVRSPRRYRSKRTPPNACCGPATRRQPWRTRLRRRARRRPAPRRHRAAPAPRARRGTSTRTDRGSDGAVELREALTQSREHDTNYEIEASLRALLRLGIATSVQEAEQWDAERSQLARTLGITYAVTPVSAGEPAAT